MSEEKREICDTCIYKWCLTANYCPHITAHNSGPDEAGQVGSSGLLVAREGDQLLDTTASQLAPLVARRIDVIDKPGSAKCHSKKVWLTCSTLQCEQCLYFYR